ncbi:MAG: hypothetical protein Q8P76_04290 [bacterium]|nr:hypothetical protein [bacterium]
MTIYLIGSLKNKEIPAIGVQLRALGYDAFDDWFAPGPEADDFWKKYEESRGRTYAEALKGHAAKHIYEFDKFHLDRADIGLLIMPAGKSAHMELGYMTGSKKPTFVLMDKPDRWDVMYQFASGIFFSMAEALEYFKDRAKVLKEIRKLKRKKRKNHKNKSKPA